VDKSIFLWITFSGQKSYPQVGSSYPQKWQSYPQTYPQAIFGIFFKHLNVFKHIEKFSKIYTLSK